MFKKLTDKSISIRPWQKDGFIKVADAKFFYTTETTNYYNHYEFDYYNVNHELMFSSHNSWIYCITLNNFIIKIGETGNRLGLPYSGTKRLKYRYHYDNPKSGSKSRLGRLKASYYNEYDTDYKIRESLYKHTKHDKDIISVWAKKCEKQACDIPIGGNIVRTEQTTHKFQEMAYLDLFYKKCKDYPILNSCRK